ncbi:hypothetical protein [Jidongwangia harbinensis]|uniref:hypothetical protein n=1 Tax=Jidongwangia harbinensis TaxID=2878561 RepID=UPI001CD9D9AD|nr:hypothetical protein [Jidongwangia harbinensis]MCA2216332.1 hypothetical protein [Jidongwangia harbinensis]MCA2217067.1 hypothetical protein [Jidongwangia harbinensis]
MGVGSVVLAGRRGACCCPTGHARQPPVEAADYGVDRSPTDERHQPLKFSLTEAGNLAVNWIYLIDRISATVAVGSHRPSGAVSGPGIRQMRRVAAAEWTGLHFTGDT